MERTLIFVRREQARWRVEGGQQPADRLDSFEAALCRACVLAGEEHRERGTPTAVAVHYYGEEAATLIGFHG